MFYYAIIGDRKRQGNDEKDEALIRQLINSEIGKPGPPPMFVSVGCDMGIGKIVKTICGELDLPFVEMSCIFDQFKIIAQHGGHIDAYLARNVAIYNLCQFFYLFVRNSRQGIIENLVKVLQENPKEYAVVVYNEDNKIIESMGFQEEGENEEEEIKSSEFKTISGTEKVEKEHGERPTPGQPIKS